MTTITLTQESLMNRLFCSFTPKDKLDQRLAEINGQYKRDMKLQVDAMMDGSLDKLIKNLDELAYTVTKIEHQAKELIAEVTKGL